MIEFRKEGGMAEDGKKEYFVFEHPSESITPAQ